MGMGKMGLVWLLEVWMLEVWELEGKGAKVRFKVKVKLRLGESIK